MEHAASRGLEGFRHGDVPMFKPSGLGRASLGTAEKTPKIHSDIITQRQGNVD